MSPAQQKEWLVRPGGLAEQLRTLRAGTGLQANELADRLGWQRSKVSRIERGQTMPSDADIRAWALACGADDVTALVQLREEAAVEQTAWTRRMRAGQKAVQEDYNELVENTSMIRYFETVWVPGFVQTPQYAHAVFAEMIDLGLTEVDDVDAAVATRMRRQQVLYDPDKRVELLVTEWVLRAQRASAVVMRGQLDRLQSVIGLDGVRFGVIPMVTPLAVTPQNGFQMYDDLVVIEGFTGEQIFKGESATRYHRLMDLLWAGAVEGDEARALILAARDALPA